MYVEKDENKIILTDLPLIRWGVGLLFSSAGLLVIIMSLWSIANANGIKDLFSILLIALFGSIFVAAGFYNGLAFDYQKITIDRWMKNMTIKRIGLRHSDTTVYPANSVNRFYCVTSTDSEDVNSYTICLILKDGQAIVLGSEISNTAECEAVIETAQTFFQQPHFSDNYQPSVVESSGKQTPFKKRARRRLY